MDEDRTSSDDGSNFSSEDEGEADSVNSEVSEPPKFGKFFILVKIFCPQL